MVAHQQQNGNLFNKTLLLLLLLLQRTTYLYKSLLREKLFIKHYCFAIRSYYEEELYKRLYPTGAGTPTLYGFPKIPKVGMPLRPIVSSIGTVTYQTAKEVARMLKYLVVKSPHVRNTQDFIHQIKGIHLNQD